MANVVKVYNQTYFINASVPPGQILLFVSSDSLGKLIKAKTSQGIVDIGTSWQRHNNPHIGYNGNWYIGPTDTGVPATGPKGSDGAPGPKGSDGAPGEQGPKGSDGAPGKDGYTPYIGSNSNWYINGSDTGRPSRGAKGQQGEPGQPFDVDATGPLEQLSQYNTEPKGFAFLATDTGDLYIKNSSTSGDWSDPIQFRGPPGYTPYIGSNSNWYINGSDTGRPSRGIQGEKGSTGAAGVTPHIDSNSYHWYIGELDTGVVAKGPKGDPGLPLQGNYIQVYSSSGYIVVSDATIPVKVQLNSTAYDIDCTMEHTNYTYRFPVAYFLAAANLTSYSGVYKVWRAGGRQGQKGSTGDAGQQGPQGYTPYIGSNSNWYINGSDTGKPSRGIQGEKGSTGAAGQDGAPGVTPHIDSTNKHWYIGSSDTGIVAQGKDGSDGKDGSNGADGITPHIGSNSNWYVGQSDTGVKASGDRIQGNYVDVAASALVDGYIIVPDDAVPVKVQIDNVAYDIDNCPVIHSDSSYKMFAAYFLAKADLATYSGDYRVWKSGGQKGAAVVVQTVTALPASPDPNVLYLITG